MTYWVAVAPELCALVPIAFAFCLFPRAFQLEVRRARTAGHVNCKVWASKQDGTFHQPQTAFSAARFRFVASLTSYVRRLEANSMRLSLLFDSSSSRWISSGWMPMVGR